MSATILSVIELDKMVVRYPPISIFRKLTGGTAQRRSSPKRYGPPGIMESRSGSFYSDLEVINTITLAWPTMHPYPQQSASGDKPGKSHWTGARWAEHEGHRRLLHARGHLSHGGRGFSFTLPHPEFNMPFSAVRFFLLRYTKRMYGRVPQSLRRSAK